MSSPFQKQFSSKNPMSPLNGAYASGADAVFAVSDAGHFAKLQSDITSATSNAMQPKLSKCETLRSNWHDKKITDKAYADASKDCDETKDEFEGFSDNEIADYKTETADYLKYDKEQL